MLLFDLEANMRPADIDPQREKNKAKLVRLIESSPGGVICADIKSVMGEMKQTAVTALMNSLSDELSLWQESDESGDIWYHHPKFNDLYQGGPAMATKGDKYKRGRKSRSTSIEEETYRKILRFCADKDCSIIDFLTAAAEEKLSREARK
jgi:hypothetical protein